MMIYNLFISHSWSYSDTYKGLVSLLDKADNFTYKNYSVPKDDPIHNAHTKAQLKAAIRNQMQHASCVLIMAGMYANYSEWIEIEIELAKEMNKRIIAIEPWAAKKASLFVKSNADEVVGWQTTSIVKAIRGY